MPNPTNVRHPFRYTERERARGVRGRETWLRPARSLPLYLLSCHCPFRREIRPHPYMAFLVKGVKPNGMMMILLLLPLPPPTTALLPLLCFCSLFGWMFLLLLLLLHKELWLDGRGYSGTGGMPCFERTYSLFRICSLVCVVCVCVFVHGIYLKCPSLEIYCVCTAGRQARMPPPSWQ